MGILFVHELLCYTTFKTYYDKWSCRPLLSSARRTSHRAGILKMLTPHYTEQSTQHSGYKTGGLHYSSCAHSAFLITISGQQQKVIIHEGKRIATALGLGNAPVQENAKCLTVSQCNTSVQSYQATDSTHWSCVKPFWAATISE